MAKRLYVGNLSYSTTDDSLRDAFSRAGEVTSATVMTDRMTGRSRGFGFVEMPNDAEADRAVETFDGKDLDGRNIKVNEARPMTDSPRPRSGGFGGGGGGGFRRDDRGYSR